MTFEEARELALELIEEHGLDESLPYGGETAELFVIFPNPVVDLDMQYGTPAGIWVDKETGDLTEQWLPHDNYPAGMTEVGERPA